MLAGPFLVILTGHGGGLAERIALYPLIIWLVAIGVSFVGHVVRRRPGRARRMEVYTPKLLARCTSELHLGQKLHSQHVSRETRQAR